jgi:hypothetical protein
MRRPTPDRALHLLAFGALAAALLLAAHARPGRSLADALPAAAGSSAEDDRYSAYFVLQRADCESHLRTLTLFRRSPVARRVRVAALLLVGTAADLADVRARYGPRPYGAPLHLLSAGAARALRGLGHSRTPFLVVTAGPRDVALTAGMPTTPEQFVALGRLLPTLPPTSTAGESR